MTNYPILDAQLADDPMAAWSLQETSGPTMADVSGYGRNGTYTDTTYGSSPVFDPAARSVTFTSAKANGTVTYSSWMDSDEWTFEIAGKWNGVSGSKLSFLAARDYSDNSSYRVFQFSIGTNSKLSATAWPSSGSYYVTTELSTNSSIVTTNTPHLFAARWKSGELSVWIDGVKVGRVTTSGVAARKNQRLVIGNYWPSSSTDVNNSAWVPFNGTLSHAAFYNKALSDARLLAHATPNPDANITSAFTQEQIVLSLTPSFEQEVNITPAFTVEDFTVQTNVTSMDALVTCDFTIEDLAPAADPYPAGDVEQTAPFEIEEPTIFGAVGGVEIVEASEEYIVEDVIFAVTPQYVDIYEVTAEFTLENPVLTASIDHNTPITPDPFTPTVVGVEMFCLLETLPAYAAPPGGLWTYDGTEMLLPAGPGWTPEV